ncbi:MAG: hypothetical protein HY040_24205 [Planctomycetes bacterium]|nr:hypothetical protein [Planctomycetota bacterium]
MTTADLLQRILEQLGHVGARCPELRFGQLIATIGMLAEDATGHSLWDVEDADFVAALERFAGDMARRESHRAESTAASDRGAISASQPPTATPPPRHVS